MATLPMIAADAALREAEPYTLSLPLRFICIIPKYHL
jgi:hypothetical protein